MFNIRISVIHLSEFNTMGLSSPYTITSTLIVWLAISTDYNVYEIIMSSSIFIKQLYVSLMYYAELDLSNTMNCGEKLFVHDMEML